MGNKTLELQCLWATEYHHLGVRACKLVANYSIILATKIFLGVGSQTRVVVIYLLGWCYCDGDFTLDFWKQYAELGGKEKFQEFKQQIINEFNTLLNIEGLPKVEDLNVLSGSFINLEYRLPNGEYVKFLDDKATYLGNQLECEFGGDRCFGIAANMDFLLVCTYEENGENPELVIYKKR